MIRLILAFSFTLSLSICFSQVNFKKDYLKNNPISKDTFISDEDKVKIHEFFLSEARIKKDTLMQVYGLFYLFADYYKTNDYVALKKTLIEAEKLINLNSKPEWQGALRMRRAYMLEIVEKDLEGAINQYKEALVLCKKALDSLCMAESLEQLSNINKNLKEYDLAEEYFKEAIVLIKKHATPSGIALAYNNYSLLASDQGKFATATKYIDSAIVIIRERKDTFNQTMYLSNKASILLKEERFHDAIALYHKLVPINIKNKWRDNLLFNYAGLTNSYEGLGQYENSNIYLQKYYELKDSLTGAEVRDKINKLELKEQVNKKELIINEKENQLIKSKSLRERLVSILLILALVIFMLLYYRYTYRKNARNEQQSNLNYIQDLGKVLKLKNSEIKNLRKKLSDNENHQSTLREMPQEDLDFKIFDRRIINDEGITAFKSYFDKIYPGLLIRVRETWPSLSDAEERLFMLIKLSIKSKEAAEILGISPSSVKKSRNRLRKRLNIDSSVDLEDFVKKIK